MPNQTSPYRAQALLPLVAATACWALGTVATKQVLDDIAPLTLLPIQLAASCVFLTVAMLVRREQLTWSPQMTRLTALGVLNPGLAYALGLIGLTSITASMSVLLWALEPVLILLLAAAVLREHIPAALAAAVGVAVLGVLLVVYEPGAAGDTLGITLTLVAVGACALYTVLTRRLLLDDGALPVVLAQQAAALAFAVLLATGVQVAGGTGWSIGDIGPRSWVAAAGSGVLYYGLAFWLFLTGLRHVRASVAGAFLPLIPVFGVSAAYLVGERLAGRQWVGAVAVVAATFAVALQQDRDRRAPEGVTPH
jgi:drug/metabolite transporter (DMT)-like permease